MLVHVGRSSLTVFTQVFRHPGKDDEEIFRAYVSFVCLDRKAKPRAVAPLLVKPFGQQTLRTSEARFHWNEVERARKQRSLITKKQNA
jgi:acyl-CoA hydrolase